ncbi:MAG: hypothetical protein ACYC1M_02510 [Armatimonadota bacterium]
MELTELRKAMLLCGVDCVIARQLLTGEHWETTQFGVVTDGQYITPYADGSGEVVNWPDDINSDTWDDLLAEIVEKLGISTAVIAFEDELPAGLLIRWQEAAPMALFRRADELKSLLS